MAKQSVKLRKGASQLSSINSEGSASFSSLRYGLFVADQAMFRYSRRNGNRRGETVHSSKCNMQWGSRPRTRGQANSAHSRDEVRLAMGRKALQNGDRINGATCSKSVRYGSRIKRGVAQNQWQELRKYAGHVVQSAKGQSAQ